MWHSLYSKIFALALFGLCASCSSSGQSVQTTQDVEKISKQALSVGIESGEKKLVIFYVMNNTAADISMLTWNTPFEQTLSADIFLVTRGVIEMPYLGRKVKRSNPGSGDYLMVPAGQKLESAVDIAKYYDLSELGEYTVKIDLPQIDGLTKLNQETAVTIDSAKLQFVVSQ
ncbi:MAG: hypothetical protein ACJAZF_003356 [Granulosicoccus sp.]|jgi:hypothetical protein